MRRRSAYSVIQTSFPLSIPYACCSAICPCLLFPPVEERAAEYQAILQEILQEKIKRRRGRRTIRAVKRRKVSRYPIRKRGEGYLPVVDVAAALEILK